MRPWLTARRSTRLLLLGCALCGALCGTAAADPPRAPSATWHGSVGAGGFVAPLGPTGAGLLGEAELFPGGGFGRVGLRVEGRTLDRTTDGTRRVLVSGGVSYLAAAAFPRLSLALHGDVGVAAPDPHLAVGGGVETQLGVVGPLAVGLEGSAHVILAGVRGTDLLLAGALTLRLAR